MNTPKAVVANSEKNYLVEIMQNNKTQFALCRYDGRVDKLIQCHQFVHCRDFMLDALAGAEDNMDMKIYGFSYSKSNPRPDTKNTSLLLKLPDNSSLKNFNDNFQILVTIEGYLGWAPSFADLVEYPDKAVVLWVYGSPSWQQSAVSFSLYTYILKCLTYTIKDKSKWMEEIKASKGIESSYMDIPHINYLLNNLNEILPKFKNFSGWATQKQMGSGIHSCSGFVSAKGIMAGGHYLKGHCLNGFAVKSPQKVAVAA